MVGKVQDKNQKEKIRGVKLKDVNILMFVIEFILFLFLVWGTRKVSDGYTQLIEATDDYMISQNEIYELERGFDYMTGQVREYVVTMDIQYVDNYFEELNQTDNGKVVKADFVKHFGSINQDICDELEEAVDKEGEMIQTDFHCMKLIAVSMGIPEEDLPMEVSTYELTETEKNFTPQEMQDTAYQLVFDEQYTIMKGKIRSEINEVRNWVSEYTSEQQADRKDMLNSAFHRQRILMAAILLFMTGMFLFVMFMIVNPIHRIIKSIKEEKILELKGTYELRYLASTYNDICRINEASKLELNQQANYDALTGVLNRGSFNRLCDFFKGSLQPLAFLLIDVDVFKSINDNYGHEVGDLALKKVANLLKRFFREEDYTIRYGGDEFVLIMSGANPSEKQVIGNKIDAINQELLNPTEPNLPPFSLSVGVAFSQKGYNEEIFHKADKALYFTKENGRCGYTFYQEKMVKKDSKKE